MGKLLSVAAMTFRAALRTRALWAVATLVVLLGLLLPPSLRDDGTASGRAMLVLGYGLGLTQALLCLAAGWLGAEVICRDLSRRHVYLLATKPLPRWQIWFGKWLGLAAVNALLLLLAGTMLWVQVQVSVRSHRWTKQQRQEAWFLVLTARTEHRPQQPRFDEMARRELEDLTARHEVPASADRAEVLRTLRRQAVAQWQAVDAGKTRTWDFHGVYPPRPAGTLTLRFRFRPAGELPQKGAEGEFRVGEARLAGPFPPDRFTHLEVPLASMRPGNVTVRFENKSPFALAFPLSDGPALLYVSGGFNGNYLRALLIMGLQLWFMTALGLTAGSLFSFPVASFVVISYLAVVVQVPLLVGQLKEGGLTVGSHAHEVAPYLEHLAQSVAGFGWRLGGALIDYQPITNLTGGLLIPWSQVLAALWWLGLVYSGLAAAPGLIGWSKRELAGGEEA